MQSNENPFTTELLSLLPDIEVEATQQKEDSKSDQGDINDKIDCLTDSQYSIFEIFFYGSTTNDIKDDQKWDIFANCIKFVKKMPKLQSLKIRKITKCKDIIAPLVFSDFRNLMHLILEDDQIQSVEPLAKVSVSFLKTLSLKNNNITCIKSLNKAAFAGPKIMAQQQNLEGIEETKPKKKQFTTLNLSDNYIREVQNIHEWKCSKLEWISLEVGTNSKQYLQIESLSWLFKIESKNPRISMNKQRIKSRQTIQKLKEKHQSDKH